jgi:hypothetical protein
MVSLLAAYIILVIYLFLFGTIAPLIILFGLWLTISLLVFAKWDSGREVNITREQASSLMLVIVALPIFIYAFRGVQTPVTYLPVNLERDNLVCNDGTIVNFTISLTFSTSGSFSAENPIHVHAVIYDANVSDLTNHIGAITFTGAANVSGTPIYNETALFGYLVLSQGSDGTYVADGDLIWHQSITCYLIPLPPFQGVIRYQNLPTGDPVLDISSVSDTLSVRSNHTMEQLTYVIVGFSVLTLQPVIGEILRAWFPHKQTESQGSSPQKLQKQKH